MNDVLKKIDKQHRAFRISELVLGLFIAAVAFNLFILPNDFVSGGVSGISIIVKRFFNVEPALFILISSLLILILSFMLLGKEKTKDSILGSLLFPLFVFLTSNISNILKLDTSDQLLYALFGGIIYGIGSGLVFKAGYTSGGTDILGQIVSKYFKMTMGNSLLVVDGFIVIIGGFVFGFAKVLYAIILLYIVSIIIDKVLLGISDSKAFYIITDKKEEISKFVIKELHHTVTILSAKGSFIKKNNPVLFTVIPTSEYYKFKEGIHIIDPNAFFTVVDAYEVLGGE